MKKFLIGIFGLLLAGTALAAPLESIAWKVPRYSMTARAMDVRQALDSFAVAQGIQVLCSEAVVGSFSGNFKDVPAAEFLDRLAAMHNLTWYYDGASIFVSSVSESLTTLIDLRYMKAAEVTAMLKELGVEDARFPLKTASDGELIMVYGPPRYVALVTEMINKADKLREQRTFTEVETRLFPLSHTWADNVSFSASGSESSVTIKGVAYLLQEIMGFSVDGRYRDSTNEVAKADAAAAGGERGSALSPIIRPENRLNAVLVRDVATRMPMYERLIRELDVPQKLVEIQITTLELSKDDSLDWQLSLKVTGAHGEFEGAAGQNAANLFNAASLAGKGLAGAASYLGKDVNVSASLSALRQKGKARNISRTSILTMNNLAAAMTDTQSYHAKVVGTEVASLEEVSAGTRLELKPRIIEPPVGSTNVPTHVWLSMILQDGGFETLTVDDMPMTRTSTLETQASLPENESLLLAGYFRDIEEEVGWGIPYLRDIPYIGWIFGGASRKKETVQRLFILTPHVINASEPDITTTMATRQRDIADVEGLQEALESKDDERKLREIDRKERREKREEAVDLKLDRREAEVEYSRRLRELERREADDVLKGDKKDWETDLKARKEAYELKKQFSK
ncbi:MAG: type III secretion system outer membrane ring subunit SctC [bacterium]|nr:type III secretion system outer membrane ring subunit SctC [bacterium]